MVPVAETRTRCISSIRGIEEEEEDDDDAVVVLLLLLLAVVVDDLLLLPVAETEVAFFFAAAAVAFPFFPFFVVSWDCSSLGLAPSDTSIPIPFNSSAILSSPTLLSDILSFRLPSTPTCHQEKVGISSVGYSGFYLVRGFQYKVL